MSQEALGGVMREMNKDNGLIVDQTYGTTNNAHCRHTMVEMDEG